MILQMLSWYFLLLILGWLVFPLSFFFFHKLPDRGYTLSRILGLLLWGFGFWLLGSLGALQNQAGGILLVLVGLVAVSLGLGWRDRKAILDWVRANWRLVLIAEMVFMVAFTFMIIVRVSNPDATGTEKPMELAFINAILNSESFPPHDPWLSGYAISYYHFGYILTAMLAKLTFTSGGVAFNLMLAAVFALSAVGAYGVLYNLLSSFWKKDAGWSGGLYWSLSGPVFLLFLSNLEAVLEMLYQAGVGWNLQTGTSAFWQWVNIEALLNPPVEPLTVVPQRFWWWWQASRVVHDIDLVGVVSNLSPIDEFPAFSFVLGDLHPHVLTIPFVMLVVGWAFNIFRGGMDRETPADGLPLPYRPGPFFISAIVLGGIIFLNTWDLPVYFTLICGAYLLRQLMLKGWAWQRLIEFLWLAIPLGLLSLLLVTPFLISFQSQAGGILPNLIYPTRGLYLWLMFGSLFVPIFLFFIWLGRKGEKGKWLSGFLAVLILIAVLALLSIGLGLVIARTEIGQQVLTSQGESTFGGLLINALLHRLGFGVSLLTLAALLVAGLSYLLDWIDSEREKDGVTPFILLMIVLGGLMVLGPEFVYLRDNFGTRMNTIFKFYYQAWMLWSLAGAFAAVVLLRKASWVSKSLVIGITLLGLLYPLFAYPSKTDGFKPMDGGYTLDAGAYLARYQPDEAAAINWLSEAPMGVVAEAVGGQYSTYARVATLSGMPSVLGWPGHEGQWRGGYEEVGSREGDIRTLFETTSWETALEIIRRYEIRYIFLGSLEMSTYGVNTLKFEQNLMTGFRQGGISIFVVSPSLID